MQGKGIIKFFLVVVALMCFIQYFYLYPTYQVEKDAEKHATEKSKDKSGKEQKAVYNATVAAYLDSMGSEQVFKMPLLPGFTYDELKQKQLALGLDLKGGMSVVLQVDLREFIYNIANNSKDPTLIEALENATAAQTGAQENYISLFTREFRKVAAKNAQTSGKEAEKLAHKFFSKNEEIDFETSDEKVEAVLRQKANETVSLTYNRLKDRIDELGVVQPNVNLDAARDLILVELPGISNPERARNFLKTTAKLEFWNVFRVTDNTDRGELVNIFLQADAKLKRTSGSEAIDTITEPPVVENDTIFLVDALGNDSLDASGNKIVESIIPREDVNDPLADAGPLLNLLALNMPIGGQTNLAPAVIGTAQGNQIKAINVFLEREDIKTMFPNDLEFRWANKPMSFDEDSPLASLFTKNTYELYAIKKDRGKDIAPIEGDRVTDASANPNPQNGEIEVILVMDGKGAKKWGEMTTVCANDQGREIAILLDDKVVSAPRVNEPILGGRSSITGGFTASEAEDLAKMLQVGKLPAKTSIIQESLVGPSLGKDNINRSLSALLIGFGLVFLFMILYYGSGGFVSILALFLNVFFIGGTLASLGTVLTLPGIAGIVLTIGMAVDANVIIYERIREELREGKTLLMSIRDGFQNSYSAIIDANVTTILVAAVLAYFGMGPIKGFAVVLIIGVISSLFTAVLVGRLMIEWWTGKGNHLSFWTGISKNAFTNLKIDWLGKRKIAYALSSVIILLGIGSMVMRGFELGVDFKGGYSYNIQIDESQQVSAESIRTALETSFSGASTVVKSVSTGNAYNVTTSYLIKENPEGADSLVMLQLHDGINTALGGNVDYANFKNPDGEGTYVNNSSKVGPTIADDIKTSSIWATIFSLLLIFGYIFIRFNKWQYSMGAVAALFHDVLFVLGIFSLFYGILPFSMEIDQAFIAAILTVIGYSINDTVVVFDRVREFMNDYTKLSKKDVINKAINSTVSRTIITSLTTLFVILILFIFGGGSIKGFAFALLIGVIVGTYSSVFIATPIMSDLSEEIKPKENKKKSFSKAASA